MSNLARDPFLTYQPVASPGWKKPPVGTSDGKVARATAVRAPSSVVRVRFGLAWILPPAWNFSRRRLSLCA